MVDIQRSDQTEDRPVGSRRRLADRQGRPEESLKVFFLLPSYVILHAISFVYGSLTLTEITMMCSGRAYYDYSVLGRLVNFYCGRVVQPPMDCGVCAGGQSGFALPNRGDQT